MNEKYKNLFTSQYHSCLKLHTWLDKVLEKTISIENILIHFNENFQLEKAEGKQLDILGEMVGASRLLNFQPTRTISATLDDEMYRMVLRAKIVQNEWKGTIPELYELWKNLFSDYLFLVKDNQDMSMDVVIIGEIDDLKKELIRYGHIIPKPEGVKINYWFFSGHIFGYDMENETFNGYDKGHWASLFESFSKPMFGYDMENEMFRGYDKDYWISVFEDFKTPLFGYNYNANVFSGYENRWYESKKS